MTRRESTRVRLRVVIQKPPDFFYSLPPVYMCSLSLFLSVFVELVTRRSSAQQDSKRKLYVSSCLARSVDTPCPSETGDLSLPLHVCVSGLSLSTPKDIQAGSMRWSAEGAQCESKKNSKMPTNRDTSDVSACGSICPFRLFIFLENQAIVRSLIGRPLLRFHLMPPSLYLRVRAPE